MGAETDDEDCLDTERGFIEALKDCIGNEKSGVDER